MTELSKLRWRCRRGMRELDALMLGWLDTHYANADDQSRQLFSELLEMQDPVIMDLINGKVTEDTLSDENIRAHENKGKIYQRLIKQICDAPGRNKDGNPAN